MNIENIRSSITVYIADLNAERSQVLHSVLKKYEYKAFEINNIEKILESIPLNPPHVLFLNHSFVEQNSRAVEQVLDISPETQIFIMSSLEDSRSSAYLYSEGVYDCLISEAYGESLDFNSFKKTEAQVLRAADRVAELSYYIYMNEQLKEQDGLGASQGSFSLFNIWMNGLKKCRTKKELLDSFMAEFSRHYAGAGVIFYKYVRSYKSLVASSHLKYPDFKEGEIIKLSSSEDKQLNNKDISAVYLQAFENFKFSSNDEGIFFLPLSVLGELKGLFVFSKREALDDPYIMSCLHCLNSAFSEMTLAKRVDSMSEQDAKTNVFNRQTFLKKIDEEVSRARRIQLPCSLIIVAIDNFANINKEASADNVNLLLKMVATVICKTGRVNDIVGRISEKEFGVLLPHTSLEGASIKAERLRSLLKEAQFSKILNEIPGITVSLGVSEYPSCSHDGDDILFSADSALLASSNSKENKVCVATPPLSFSPDFSV